MKNNKIIKIILIIGALILVGIGVLLIYQKMVQDKMVDVTVASWDDLSKEYTVARVRGESFSLPQNCEARFNTRSKLDKIVKDSDDYVGMYEYHSNHESTDSYLFYNDNNYYVVYEEDRNEYKVENLYSTFVIASMINVPTPMEIRISTMTEDDKVIPCDEVADEISYFFENCTYDEAKEFYSRMDEDIVNVNDDEKKILVTGYAVSKKKYIEGVLLIDFNNKMMVITDSDGTKVECR